MTTKQQAAEAFERYLETGNLGYAKGRGKLSVMQSGGDRR